jgi:hypothetical protein
MEEQPFLVNPQSLMDLFGNPADPALDFVSSSMSLPVIDAWDFGSLLEFEMEDASCGRSQDTDAANQLIKQAVEKAALDPTGSIQEWSNNPLYMTLNAYLAKKGYLDTTAHPTDTDTGGGAAAGSSVTVPAPATAVSTAYSEADAVADVEFLRLQGIAEGQNVQPPPTGTSTYQHTISMLRDTFQQTLDEETHIAKAAVDRAHQNSRANRGEPLMECLLQASLEECERRSTHRRRDILRRTANAVRQLRSNSMPERRRRNLRPRATIILTEWFDSNRESPYPDDEEKRELAEKAEIGIEQVSNWFSNRRNRRLKGGV